MNKDDTLVIDSEQKSTVAFLESARLLIKLHALFVQGIDEGVEADSIRDEMDAPWYHMTSVERDRVRWLSEDLFATTGLPCWEKSPSPSPPDK